jgi:hypothetical protein
MTSPRTHTLLLGMLLSASGCPDALTPHFSLRVSPTDTRGFLSATKRISVTLERAKDVAGKVPVALETLPDSVSAEARLEMSDYAAFKANSLPNLSVAGASLVSGCLYVMGPQTSTP